MNNWTLAVNAIPVKAVPLNAGKAVPLALTILPDAAALETSSSVVYLLLVLGVPLVPASASFSSCVGTLPSLSHTNIGVAGATGATDTLPIPFVLVVASGLPAIASPSAYAFVANWLAVLIVAVPSYPRGVALSKLVEPSSKSSILRIIAKSVISTDAHFL